MTRNDEDNIPLTTGLLIRRGTIIASVAAALVGFTLWLADLRTDISSLKQQATYQESRLIQLENHSATADKSIADLKSQLDKAVTVLERIDRKLGQP